MKSRFGSYATEFLGLAVLLDRPESLTLDGPLGFSGVSLDGLHHTSQNQESSCVSCELHLDLTREFSVAVTRHVCAPP